MTCVVIMQPEYLPWIGLFEQIRLADVFVHLDDAQFSKGARTNRVKVKLASGAKWMTVPLEKHSLGDAIADVRINDGDDWRHAHMEMVKQAYKNAPHVDATLDLLAEVHAFETDRIAPLDIFAIEHVCDYLGLSNSTRFAVASELSLTSHSTQRVIDIVEQFEGDIYVTGHGAANYLDHDLFEQRGIRVEYMNYQRKAYPQLHGTFDPHMSILDAVANLGRNAADVIDSPTTYWKDFVRG